MQILFLTLTAAGVLFWGRRIPLSGWKRTAVILCRLAALALLLQAIPQRVRVTERERPQQVVYAVDLSNSMDAKQRLWAAERIASLEAVRPRDVRRAVVAFGSTATVIEPLGKEPLEPDKLSKAFDAASVGPEQTDVEQSLLVALKLLSADGGGRIILLSDGRETAGNAGRILPHIRRLGISVYPEPPPAAAQAAISWEAVSVPPVVQRGQPVPIRLVLNNGTGSSTMAEISIAVSGVVIKKGSQALRPGWRVLSVAVPALQQGTLALDVRVRTPQGFDEQRPVYTEVEGPPHVLFVDERTNALPLAARALQQRQMEVSLVQPSEVPTDPRALLNYDAVFLFNIPKSSLSVEQVSALRSFLEDSGGGLVMAGLGGDLAEELRTTAPLDALLPVTFEAKGLQETKRRVCMIMLVDRSASMFGPRLAATKRAAVALVNQLAAEDLAGVLAFDTKAYVVMEMQPVGNARQELIDKLVKLHSTGGTDVLPALIAAQNRLEPLDAQIKHVILLSDGQTPFNLGLYRALMESFRQDGISISTIGIGAAFINEEYLQWLADKSGGNYYLLQTLDDLPKLVAQDVKDSLGRLPFSEGKFGVKTNPASVLFSDAPWPTVGGFLTATAKPEASVDLTVQGGDEQSPLLAGWSVGLGRSVVFTSDADTRWSPDWLSWDGFEGWMAQVVRWAMRPRFAEELFISVAPSAGVPRLVIEGPLDNPQGSLIPASQENARPLSLIQSRAFRWEASLEGLPSGWYQLALSSHPEGEAPRFTKRWLQIGEPPQTREAPGQPAQAVWLRAAAEASGGWFAAPDAAFLPPSTHVLVREPVSAWWLPLVLMLLLAEIALRGSSQF